MLAKEFILTLTVTLIWHALSPTLCRATSNEAVFSVKVLNSGGMEPCSWPRYSQPVYLEVRLDTTGLTNGIRMVSFKIRTPPEAVFKGTDYHDPYFEKRGCEACDFFAGQNFVIDDVYPSGSVRRISGLKPPTTTNGVVAIFMYDFIGQGGKIGDFLRWEVYDTGVWDNPNLSPLSSRGSAYYTRFMPSDYEYYTGFPAFYIMPNQDLRGHLVPDIYVGRHANRFALQSSLDGQTWNTLLTTQKFPFAFECNGIVYTDWNASTTPRCLYRLQLLEIRLP